MTYGKHVLHHDETLHDEITTLRAALAQSEGERERLRAALHALLDETTAMLYTSTEPFVPSHAQRMAIDALAGTQGRAGIAGEEEGA